MPRRSNACETCKRRKVKCDEGKPTCDRCARQGYECEGYVDRTTQRRRSPAFRDQTQRVAQKAEASYVRSSSSAAAAASTPTSNSAARDAALLRKFAQIHEDEWPTLLLSSKPRMSYLPPLARIDESRERRAQLVSNFIYAYLPTTDGGAIWQSNYTYMYMLQDFTGQHPAIPSAVDALCLAIAGLTHGDANLVAKARNIYGAALNRLAATLNKARAYAPTGTMAAIAVLAWCELNQGGLSGTGGSGGGEVGSGGTPGSSSNTQTQYAAAATGGFGGSNNANAWENHVEGAVTLLESFEPDCWDTNEGRMLLQGLRYGVITVCLIRRRAVAVFTRPGWSGLVVATHPSDDPWVHLNDLSAHVPELLEEGDQLTASLERAGGAGSGAVGANLQQAVDSLLQRCLHLRRQLHRWYAELEASTPSDAVRLVTAVSQDWWEPTGFDDAMPFVLAYSEYRQCHLRAMLYWALLTLDEQIISLNDCGLIQLPSNDLNSAAITATSGTPGADPTSTGASPHIQQQQQQPSTPFSPAYSPSSFPPSHSHHHDRQPLHEDIDHPTDEYSTPTPYDPSFDPSFSHPSQAQQTQSVPSQASSSHRSGPHGFLLSSSTSSASPSLPPSRAQLDAEALHFADQAARSVPVSFDPATPPVSKYNAAVSLRLATDAYAARGFDDRVAWCRALQVRLERGFFVPELMRIAV